MSIPKRFLFAMLFTIVALAAAGRVSVYKAELLCRSRILVVLPVPVVLHCLGTTAGRQTCQVDGSRHSERRATCCRGYLFRFNSRTPRI